MNRPLGLTILIFGLIFLGLGTLNSGFLIIAIPLMAYLGMGMLNFPTLPNLEFHRDISSERTGKNMPFQVDLHITNMGEQLENVIIRDVLPQYLKIVRGETSILLNLPPKSTAELSYTVRGDRGYYRFREIRVKTGDALGLYTREKTFISPGHIFILPETWKLKNFFIQPRQTLIYSGVIPSRQAGSGVEFYGVRSYQTGDPLRRINWKASARHLETYYSNEFQQERVADVRLILDARRRSDVQSSEGSLFEHSISATAALAQYLLINGNRVGLLIYGKYLDLTHPGYGKIQYERILRALARAQVGDSPIFERLDYLPDRFLPIQAQIILVTPLLKEDTASLLKLRARGHQVMVISPNPILSESKGLSPDNALELGSRLASLERRLVESKLHRAGISYLNWPVDKHLDQVLQLTVNRLRSYIRSRTDLGAE